MSKDSGRKSVYTISCFKFGLYSLVSVGLFPQIDFELFTALMLYPYGLATARWTRPSYTFQTHYLLCVFVLNGVGICVFALLLTFVSLFCWEDNGDVIFLVFEIWNVGFGDFDFGFGVVEVCFRNRPHTH